MTTLKKRKRPSGRPKLTSLKNSLHKWQLRCLIDQRKIEQLKLILVSYSVKAKLAQTKSVICTQHLVFNKLRSIWSKKMKVKLTAQRLRISTSIKTKIKMQTTVKSLTKIKAIRLRSSNLITWEPFLVLHRPNFSLLRRSVLAASQQTSH